MMKIKPLSPQQLCIKCKPSQLDFNTTSHLPEVEGPLGQDRALAAIELGIHIPQNGYNLYLLGPEGTGKHHLINSLLRQQSRLQTSADDWCYVHNFDKPEQPLYLKLPCGMGPLLQKDMMALIDTLVTIIPTNPPHSQSQDEYPLKQSLLTLAARAIGPLREKYSEFESVLNYLNAVEADVVESNLTDSSSLSRYQVNVLVTHVPGAGAPVIYEDFPSLNHIIGEIEHLNQLGTYVPHYTLIRAGALHRANGGYLILDAHQIVNRTHSWEALKRALLSKKIVIENSETTIFPSMVSLEPQAIPLNIKVILLGERALYYSLCENDMNFSNLFKVAADFSNHIPRTDENLLIFAGLLGTIARRDNLLDLNRHAVAKVIDQSTRLANDQLRLYTNMRFLVDLLRESHYWAKQNQHKVIKAIDVQTAIDQQIYRCNRIQMRIREDFSRNILLVDTKGKKIGQVNGLSVLQIGHYSFGSPSRITATVRLGKGEVIDIEREVELGGALHSKGVLILSGFINGRYLIDRHLSFSASLVFEQNYGEVEGDSASAAELAALLSAISRLPIKQCYALTGSVNQFGQIQTVGNINEKIEGFFEVCRLKGLNGRQGVIIPAGNIQHLMLRDDVLEAAKKKNFFVYGVETIDQLMSILTGLPPGKANKKGHFPDDTINGIVEQNLLKYTEQTEDDKDHTQ